MKQLILKSLQTIGHVVILAIAIGGVLALGGVDLILSWSIGCIVGPAFLVLLRILNRLEYVSHLMKSQRDERVKTMLFEQNNQATYEPKKPQRSDVSTLKVLNESRPTGSIAANAGQQKPYKRRYHKKKYPGSKSEKK